jgi:predicted DNA-binding transcriptional regulator AlpA
MTAKLQETLVYPLRWLRAERAALYLDMSRSKFLELVDSGNLPGPASIDGIKLWDRAELDAAIEARKGELDDGPADSPPNSFDAVIQMSRRRPRK